MEDEIPPLPQDVRMIATKSTDTAARVGNMENQLRRSNIQIVGMPERAEGKNPVDFTLKTGGLILLGKINNLTPVFPSGKGSQGAISSSTTRGP